MDKNVLTLGMELGRIGGQLVLDMLADYPNIKAFLILKDNLV